ncbi:MAG: hypothetical protein WBW81_06410 [Methylocella sp.]
MFPTINKRLARVGFIFGLLLLGGAATIAFVPGGNAQSIPAQQSAQNVTSYGQQGGITAGIVNIGPQRLAFSSQLGSELLAKMPSKKKVIISSVGGEADQSVATEIQKFLQQNGYVVTRESIGMLVPPPDHKISLGEGPKEYDLIVAPSAN